MGYYECPRCGSKDSYQGTEHVLHEKRGNQITMVNEAGMAMTRETGDGTEQVELMVVKCRNCGESLGQKRLPSDGGRDCCGGSSKRPRTTQTAKKNLPMARDSNEMGCGARDCYMRYFSTYRVPEIDFLTPLSLTSRPAPRLWTRPVDC